MGARQSKEESLYHQVNHGNVQGIKALRRDGAGLEWADKEGKTPLVLACMRSDRLDVAKLLIELGANVNAYRPGSNAGTPLHHAAKRGLDKTVNLLLSHGANPLAMNDDKQTPLDLARAKGHCKVVHAIEGRICIFSGWLREIHGPTILETFAPQWVSRKIWAVVLPCDSHNPMNPRKFDLAIYPDLKVSKPRVVIALWKARIDYPIKQHDTALIIVENTKQTRYKFLPANEGDKQQLMCFYNACKGIFQKNSHIPGAPAGSILVPSPMANQPCRDIHVSTAPTAAPAPAEDTQLAMAISASIQTAIAEGIPTAGVVPPSVPIPSAPPILEETFYNGPIRYPSVDSSPINSTVPATESQRGAGETKEVRSSSSSSGSGYCVVCLDARVEGACIPCGHMAGCLSCLNVIKAKGWGCPVCRAQIDQVVKLFAV